MAFKIGVKPNDASIFNFFTFNSIEEKLEEPVDIEFANENMNNLLQILS